MTVGAPCCCDDLPRCDCTGGPDDEADWIRIGIYFTHRFTRYYTAQSPFAPTGLPDGPLVLTRPRNSIIDQSQSIYVEASCPFRCSQNVLGSGQLGWKPSVNENPGKQASTEYSALKNTVNGDEAQYQARGDFSGPSGVCPIKNYLRLSSETVSASGSVEADEFGEQDDGSTFSISGGTYVDLWRDTWAQPGTLPPGFVPEPDYYYRYFAFNINVEDIPFALESFDRETIDGQIVRDDSDQQTFLQDLDAFYNTCSYNIGIRGLYEIGPDCDFYAKGTKIIETTCFGNHVLPFTDQQVTDLGQGTGFPVPGDGRCPDRPAFTYNREYTTRNYFNNGGLVTWNVNA